MFYNSDDKIADKRFEQILASLKSKDKEASSVGNVSRETMSKRAKSR